MLSIHNYSMRWSSFQQLFLYSHYSLSQGCRVFTHVCLFVDLLVCFKQDYANITGWITMKLGGRPGMGLRPSEWFRTPPVCVCVCGVCGVCVCVCVCVCLTPLAVRALVSLGLAVLTVRQGGGLRGGTGATTVLLFHWGWVSDRALVAVVVWQRQKDTSHFGFSHVEVVQHSP